MLLYCVIVAKGGSKLKSCYRNMNLEDEKMVRQEKIIDDMIQEEPERKTKKTIALERKEEILKTINQYNEEILTNGVSEISESLVEELEEEYAILDDEYPEKVVEEYKESWFSRVSWWILAYPFLITFLTLPSMVKIIGLEVHYVIRRVVPNMPVLSALWFYLAVILFLYPIIILVITWTINGFIKKSENKRAFKWVFIYHIAYFVITTLWILFDFYLPTIG